MADESCENMALRERILWWKKQQRERPSCGLDFLGLESGTLATLGLIFLDCQIIGRGAEGPSISNIL